jgi:hypothetical protein
MLKFNLSEARRSVSKSGFVLEVEEGKEEMGIIRNRYVAVLYVSYEVSIIFENNAGSADTINTTTEGKGAPREEGS